MDALTASLVLSISLGIVFSVAYLHLWSTIGKAYLKHWYWAWTFYTLKQVSDLLAVAHPHSRILHFLIHAFLVASGFRMVSGTTSLFGLPSGIIRVFGALSIVVAFADALGIARFGLPILLSGFMLLYSGFLFVRFRHMVGGIATCLVLGVSLSVWGIHGLDYIALRDVPDLAPLGFTMGTVLNSVAAVSLLILSLQQAIKEKDSYNRRFQALFNLAKDSIMILDDSGNILDVNEEAMATYGYGYNEFRSMNIRGIRTQFDMHLFEGQFEQAKSVDGLHMESIHRRKDGTTFNVEVRSKAGTIDCETVYVSIIRDVTTRKQMEDILEATSDIVVIADLDGNIEYLNRSGRIFLGMTDDLGRPINVSGILPEWAYRKHMGYGMPVALETGIWQGETAIMDKAGNEVPMSQVIIAHRKADGSVDYASMIMRDITVQKESERLIRQGKENLRSQYYNLPHPVLTYRYIGGDFVLEDYSKAAEGFTNGIIAEYLGKSAKCLFGHRRDILEMINRCHGNKESLSFQTPYKMTTTKEFKHIVFTFTYIPTDMVLVHSEDATARVEAETKLREGMERTRLLSGYSEELAKSGMDRDSVLGTITRTVSGIFGDGCAVHLIDDNGAISPAAFHEPDPKKERFIRLLLKSGFHSSMYRMLLRVSNTLHPVTVSGILPERTRMFVKPGFRRYLQGISIGGLTVVPLRHADQSIGTLSVWRLHGETGHSPEDRAFLSELAKRAAQAIVNMSLFQEVQTGREQMRILSRRLVEVQEDEKRFIAHELHDEMGQTLTALKMSLASMDNGPTGDSGAGIGELMAYTDDLLAKVRQLSLDLRPPMLDDLGLFLTLVWHFNRFTGLTGIRIEFNHSDMEDVRFPPEVEIAAYRIIQEALNNVAKYAETDEAFVRVWHNDGVVGLEVMDRGKGFNLGSLRFAHNSSGISGMKERALGLGGGFEIDTALGRGTRITVTLDANSGRIGCGFDD